VITGGIGTMPAVGSRLDDSLLSRLVAYVDALTRGGVSGGVAAGPGAAGRNPADPRSRSEDSSSPGVPGGAESVTALGGNAPSTSPLPIGNPVGWTLALAIAATLILLGSTLTGVMPKEVEPAGNDTPGGPGSDASSPS
jgi:hypothetical protein